MDKHTIGSFMAALRRAMGLTQQEVADRLSVSNKTVSKWERDESSPDIGLIPAIAELFGVTCEELLLGRRAAQANVAGVGVQGSAEGVSLTLEDMPPRAEKQLRRMIGSALTLYKNSVWLSVLFAAAGLIALFTVAYGFFRPVLGFGLCALMCAMGAAFTVAQRNLAQHRLDAYDFPQDETVAVRDATGALKEETGAIKRAMATMGRYAYVGLVVNISAVILALPFMTYRDAFYVDSVLTFDSYLTLLPAYAALCALAAAVLLGIMWRRMDMPKSVTRLFMPTRGQRLLNLYQLGFPVVFTLITWATTRHIQLGTMFIWTMIVMSVSTTWVFAAKAKSVPLRALAIVAGARNLAWSCFVMMMVTSWGTVQVEDGVTGVIETHRYYDGFPLGVGLLFIMLVWISYLVVKHYMLKWLEKRPGKTVD